MKVKSPCFFKPTPNSSTILFILPSIHPSSLCCPPLLSKPLFSVTYEYSNNEMGANKKEGQVKLERSPVNEARVFKKEEKLPC
jgi:hypothetical protein